MGYSAIIICLQTSKEHSRKKKLESNDQVTAETEVYIEMQRDLQRVIKISEKQFNASLSNVEFYRKMFFIIYSHYVFHSLTNVL